MDFNSLLLITIIWLLWTIHQDLMESNDRQRSLKTALATLATRFEDAVTPAAKKKGSKKTTTKPTVSKEKASET